MGRTPDRRPGESDEEGIVLENRLIGDDPSVAGGLRFVNGSFSLRDSLGLFNPRTGASAVFGEAYQFAASEVDSTISANAYGAAKVTLSPVIATAGTYLIFWHALIRTSSANKDFQVRAQLDNITDLSEIKTRVAIANQHYDFSGLQAVSLSVGAHTIDIDWSSTSSSATIISKARLAIWRVV